VQLDAATQPAAAFWQDEFDPLRKLPAAMQDLVIYELHVGALGFGKPTPGTLDDAVALLDHLAELGVNAVELLPIAEFENIANWGYGTAQFMAIDQAAGGQRRPRRMAVRFERPNPEHLFLVRGTARRLRKPRWRLPR
jgi:1,4-alpha-glucan branching enzyme